MKYDKPDSLIFDMDGTLWDAVDTYVFCWNEAFKKTNPIRKTNRNELVGMMGWEKQKVINHFFKGENVKVAEEIFDTIEKIQDEILPIKGGLLYPGVKEGLITLSKKYKIFILSNCPENTLKQFVKWAEIDSLIVDHIAHGYNLKPKNHNMKLLIDKHCLKKPFYIGDTETDSLESRKAEIPFVFLSYGFGKTKDYDLKFDDFNSFTNYFMAL
jgi:phosphoglycolate phosphatase